MNQNDDQQSIPEGELEITLFNKKEIRKVFHNNEWYFSVIDIIVSLTDTPGPTSYWGKMKSEEIELGRISTKLKIPSKDGKNRYSECANVEGTLRLIQSIASPKAEPFKKWLAKTGYERIQEFQNPEIAVKRAILDYKLKGRSEEWINTRIRTILTRKELTDEWKKRQVKDHEYGILTNDIAAETFDIVPKDHKKLKNLGAKDQLRDHMTDMELILTMLGEKSTTHIAQKRDTKGFFENRRAAKDGGRVAGMARKGLEAELGKPVVSSQNFLDPTVENLSLPESE